MIFIYCLVWYAILPLPYRNKIFSKNFPSTIDRTQSEIKFLPDHLVPNFRYTHSFNTQCFSTLRYLTLSS